MIERRIAQMRAGRMHVRLTAHVRINVFAGRLLNDFGAGVSVAAIPPPQGLVGHTAAVG